MEENTQPATEPKAKPIKVQMVKEEPKVDRKTELMQKKAKDRDRLPPEEEKELQAIMAAEALEKRKGALLHKLVERADKAGRKQVGEVKKKITSHVAAFSQEKSLQIKGVNDAFGEALKELDKITKKAMQDVQEAHNKSRAEIVARNNERTTEITKLYQVKYDDAELEMDSQIQEVANAIGAFQSAIQNLTIEQLEELEKNGVVAANPKGKETDFISVPDYTQIT